MNPPRKYLLGTVVSILLLACSGAGGGGGNTPPAPTITSVSVTPTSPSLLPNGTQVFTAMVAGTGSFSSGVQWSSPAGSFSNATANPTTFTAPATGGTYTVTVASTQDLTKTASAVVTVSAVTAVLVSPSTAALVFGATQQFDATVLGTGPYGPSVAWSSSGGSITVNGLYTAPAVAGTYTVTATSVHDGSKSGSATVTVSAPSTITGVAVSPATANLRVGGTQQFAATVTGTGNYSTAVDWLATGGTITATGFYTAPSTAGTYSITALSFQDGSKFGTATVTVTDPGNLALLAGAISGQGCVDGPSHAARFFSPTGVARDGSGNIYVADMENRTIRRISPAGVVSTLAGTAGQIGSTDGQGAAARFVQPWGIAVDGAGNVFVADDMTIRKVSPSGLVSTFAGAARTSGSNDGQGGSARFFGVCGIATDGAGNLYVADTWNHTIRKISPTGEVSTLAGLAGQSGSSDGPGSAARFKYPDGIAVDASGNILVADYLNSTIRKITPAGWVSTLAGAAGVTGSTDGPGSAARFWEPRGLVLDAAGNVLVADTRNNTIRKITPAGVVSTLAGLAGSGGAADGPGNSARFFFPIGLCLDGAGNILVADEGNDAIRNVSASGSVSTYAGLLGAWGGLDGLGSAALFYYPRGLAMDSAGNAYLADTYNHAIRKITPAGQVTTFAGTLGQNGEADGPGGAARFAYPHSVAVDRSGNVYVADDGNHTIRKITPSGATSTLAGMPGQSGVVDGLGSAARLYYPRGIAVDDSGNVYVSDYWNHTIRKVTAAGMVSTFAGSTGQIGSADGLGTAARFKYPYGLTVDAAGNVYVVDSNNHTLRKITTSGMVSTLAGLAGETGSADGQGGAARFNAPWFVTIGASGNLYVADAYNGTIRKVTPAGVVSTVIGVAGQQGTFPGALPALLAQPRGVAVSPSGQLYIVVRHALLVATAGSGTFPIQPAAVQPGTAPAAASEPRRPVGSGPLPWLMPSTSEEQPGRNHLPECSSEDPPGTAGK